MYILKKLGSFFSNDIGIDLGTANTLVFVKGQGIVVREPSVVAVNHDTKEIKVGLEAKRMLGRTPGSITASRPMKDGVIADFKIAEHMLRYFIAKGNTKPMRPLRVVIAVPSGITAVEERAVKDSAIAAGASAVELLREPMAAAIGCGLPIADPIANMIVDVGGGTSEVAIISLGDVVDSSSIRVGGDELDRAIEKHMKEQHGLVIGPRMAEEIKCEIGSAIPMPSGNKSMDVRGRDANGGLPNTVHITEEEIRDSLQVHLNEISDMVTNSLERIPPELSGDLIGQGMVLSGGGALIPGLDLMITEKTGLPVIVAENPLDSVANGTGIYLNNLGAS
ncbi:MAG: rod shape-determining protein [Opitutales bacterium]